MFELKKCMFELKDQLSGKQDAPNGIFADA